MSAAFFQLFNLEITYHDDIASLVSFDAIPLILKLDPIAVFLWDVSSQCSSFAYPDFEPPQKMKLSSNSPSICLVCLVVFPLEDLVVLSALACLGWDREVIREELVRFEVHSEAPAAPKWVQAPQGHVWLGGWIIGASSSVGLGKRGERHNDGKREGWAVR